MRLNRQPPERVVFCPNAWVKEKKTVTKKMGLLPSGAKREFGAHGRVGGTNPSRTHPTRGGVPQGPLNEASRLKNFFGKEKTKQRGPPGKKKKENPPGKSKNPGNSWKEFW